MRVMGTSIILTQNILNKKSLKWREKGNTVSGRRVEAVVLFTITAVNSLEDMTIEHIEDHQLDTRTHNKAITKARESNRITPKQKDYLKSLK